VCPRAVWGALWNKTSSPVAVGIGMWAPLLRSCAVSFRWWKLNENVVDVGRSCAFLLRASESPKDDFSVKHVTAVLTDGSVACKPHVCSDHLLTSAASLGSSDSMQRRR
jgi:hypothetical protein